MRRIDDLILYRARPEDSILTDMTDLIEGLEAGTLEEEPPPSPFVPSLMLLFCPVCHLNLFHPNFHYVESSCIPFKSQLISLPL